MALRQIIVVFLVFSSISCISAMFCEKIDFNRIAYEKIQQCTLQNLPKLEIKNYAATTNVKPFRPTSSYYLSTVPIGYSCSQTTKTYTLNQRTRIEAAIFLKSFEYANVEISVYDVDLRQKMHSWMIGASDGKPTSWFVFHGEVAQNISNAVVKVFVVFLAALMWKSVTLSRLFDLRFSVIFFLGRWKLKLT